MNWTLVMIRGLKVPGAVFLLAVAMAVFCQRLAITDSSAEMFMVAKVAYGSGAVFLIGGIVLLFWRLRRWDRGEGPSCNRCGGPQGGIRDGKVYWGRQLPDFRRCYCCNSASPVAR